MQPWKPDQQQIQQQPILAQQQIQQQRIQQQQKESPLRRANHPTALAEPPNVDGEALVFAAARDALEKQEWAASVGGFTELLSSSRYAADARYGLGWIELQQGSLDRAAALFREATQYNERHANAWYALGRLAEARSVPEAIAHYRRAVAAEPTHYGAAERLRLLGQAGERFSHDKPPSAPTPNPSGAIAPTDVDRATQQSLELPDPGQLGVVEFLHRDKSPVSQQALARINSLNRSTRFRFAAHIEQLLKRLVLLVGPAAVISYILFHITPLQIGSSTVHFYSSSVREVIEVAILAWAAWAAWAGWTLLDCVTNTITIANGRIRWGHGVLDKHFETLDVWTVRDIDLDRNALQRLTGDGTLTFKGTLHDRPSWSRRRRTKPLSLTGIARGDELDRIYADLLDLKFLLRANPGLKGIIQ
jgi:tetratricopeptide (TPR) repeat protein